jgi:tetratricopeptide (TPR) repeat protein
MNLDSPPSLVRFVTANLAYWRELTHDMTEARYVHLSAERQNLYLAVQAGLRYTQTWTDTTELILQLFEFIEIQGYWWEWIQIFEQAIQHCPLNHEAKEAQLLNRLGFLYRLNSQVEQALETHQNAQALAFQAGAQLEEAYAHFFLSDDYLALEKYPQAEHHCRLALEGFQALGVTGLKLAAVLNTRGMIAHALGDYARADRDFLETIAICRAHGRAIKQANGLNNLAITLQAQGKVEEALCCLQEARDLLAATFHKVALIHTQLSLGSLYFSMGEFVQAEATFREVDRAYLQQVNLSYLAFTLNNLGNTLLALGQFEEAGPYLEQSIAHWRALENKMMLGNTLGDLAKTRAQQGQVAVALALYEEAIALLAGFPQNAWARKRYEVLVREQQVLNGTREAHSVSAG